MCDFKEKPLRRHYNNISKKKWEGRKRKNTPKNNNLTRIQKMKRLMASEPKSWPCLRGARTTRIIRKRLPVLETVRIKQLSNNCSFSFVYIWLQDVFLRRHSQQKFSGKKTMKNRKNTHKNPVYSCCLLGERKAVGYSSKLRFHCCRPFLILHSQHFFFCALCLLLFA